jgi:hypothetical protein
MLPGYDGFPPVKRAARGSLVVDAKTGKMIRAASDGLLNINTDRIEWLLAHGQIDPRHHEAGRRLQGDWEMAQIITYSSSESVGCGSCGSHPSDAKVDAMARVGAAHRHVGRALWRVIEAVVIDGHSLGKAEGILRLQRKSAIGYLIGGLDCLAGHYGL